MINKKIHIPITEKQLHEIDEIHPFSQRHIPLFVIVEIGQNETIYT